MSQSDAYRRAAQAAELLSGPNGHRPEVLARAMSLLNNTSPPRRAAVAHRPAVTVDAPDVTMRLTGKVGPERAAGGAYFTLDSVARQLRVADQTAHVRVEIDSSGGTTEEALAIYGLLRGHRGLVTTVATGSCQSAGGIVFMAGARRIASADARFLVHGTSYPDGYARNGFVDAAALAEDAKYLEAVNETILRIFVDRGTANEARFRNLMAAGREFSADTAKALGIVHAVIPGRPPLNHPRFHT